MKVFTYLLLGFFLVIIFRNENLYSQNFEYNTTDLEKIFIVFSPNQKIYYLNAPIFFNYQVENQILNTNFRFKQFSNPFIQFELFITKADNQVPFSTISLDAFEYYNNIQDYGKIEKKSSKVVELAFEESFMSKINLSDFINLTETGRYNVSGFFYPLGRLDNFENLNESSVPQNSANSNALYRIALQPFSFRVVHNRSLALAEYPVEEMLRDSRADSSSANFATREDGSNIFSSPQSLMQEYFKSFLAKDWVAYLETFHLGELLKNSYNTTVFYERFSSALSAEQPFILADFKKFLIDSITYEIKEFVILKTTIEREARATVRAYVTIQENYEELLTVINQITLQQEETWIRQAGELVDKNFIYEYELMNYSGVWKIVRVEARLVNQLPEAVNPADLEINNQNDLESLEQTELIGNVFFDSGRAEIRLESLGFLENVYNYLEQNPKVKLRLVGHTDSDGAAELNVILSEQRTQAVANFFINKGISENKIVFSFQGENMPIDNNNTSIGRQQNRRVELFLFQ